MFLFQWFFSGFSSLKMYTSIGNFRLCRLSLCWFVEWSLRNYAFLSYYDVVRYFSFLTLCYEKWGSFWWYWNVLCFPVKQLTSNIFDYFGQFSSRSFMTWCKSSRLDLSPLCMANRNTLQTWFMFSVKPILFSKLAMIKFFSVRTARSTAPDPVRRLGGSDSILMFFLQNSF